MRLPYLLLPLLPALTVLALPAGQDILDGRQAAFDILVVFADKKCVAKWGTSLHLSYLLSPLTRSVTEELGSLDLAIEQAICFPYDDSLLSTSVFFKVLRSQLRSLFQIFLRI